jgi:hypothetical protein
MFKSLKKINEYSLLGHSMNHIAIMLNEFIEKYNNSDGEDDFKENLYLIAYLARNGIIDRMEEYDWNMEGPILVPAINSNNISLFYAYGKTVLLLNSISLELDLNYEVKSILNKESAYYEFEKLIPYDELKKINETYIKMKK